MSTAPELPDPAVPALRGESYLRPLRAGEDTVALGEALRKAAPRLRRYAARRLGDAHEAEEVVQETLLRACQHRPGFATEDDLMAWGTVVTGRLVIDRLRQRGRSVSVPEVPEGTRTGRDTADVVVARDEARAALDALDAMPARQAAVLWCREIDGLSYDEIAARFGLSEPTVRSLLHRARRTLRREYAARGGTLPVGGVLVALAPWRESTHAINKLRALARQTLAPAASGAAALTIIGATAVFIGPGGPHTGADRRAPAVAISAQPAATATASPSAPSTVAPTTAPRAVPRSSATPARTAHGPVAWTLRDPHCVDNSGKRAGTQTGVNCAPPDPTAPVLVVRPPLNPTSAHLGISSDKVPCRHLPNTPVSRCETGTPDPAPVKTP